MSATASGLLILFGLLALLAIGTPIAFALGAVSLAAIFFTEGLFGLSYVAETFFHRMADFGLVAIPMFILMGSAVASSPIGREVYSLLDRWLNRVPGGLVLSNLGACGLFAALSGSSPATCAAIGKRGIPEMLQRGYPPGVAAGAIAAGGTLGILIPPSVTLIVYGIATETSIGRLFLAGVIPGLMLVGLFMLWSLIGCHVQGYRFGDQRRYSLAEKFSGLHRVLPFLLLIVGILYVLYGGVATPSEAAGAGALLCILMVVTIYGMWRLRPLSAMFNDTVRESVMIMLIIAAADLFAYVLSSLFITQSIAQWIAALEVNRWVLMGMINGFLLVAGFFLPPVAVILMTAPILLPIILSAGFDPYWFAIVLTINMEIGLITPPVGLNLFIINGIAPQISLQQILLGSLPFVLCMVLGIVILCVFPGIVTWLPDLLMGPAR